MAEVKAALLTLSQQPRPTCLLTFSHPEIKHGLANDGIPQLNVDQLNSRDMFHNFSMPKDALAQPTATIHRDGDVYIFVTKAMILRQGKLLKDEDWNVWQQSEFTQLDQYEAQGMFGDPIPVTDKGAIFNLA